MIKTLSFLVTLFFALAAHSQVQQEAVYEMTFTSLWNKTDHVFDLPRGAHFSPLVITVHSDNYVLVREGSVVNKALELVSELGQTSLIEVEISNAINKGTISSSIITENQFINTESSQTVNLKLTSSFSKVSLVSMIAPSPDWIVALDSLDLFGESGFIKDSGEIFLFGYNAGSENGDRGGNFSIFNLPTFPKDPVSRLNGVGFEKPFAKVRFVKVD